MKSMVVILLAVLATIPLSVVAGLAGPVKVADDIPSYRKVQGVSGNLNIIGSDTLSNVVSLWAEEFRKRYLKVDIQVEGKGSRTAPKALIEGTAQIGPVSRQMTKSELEAFEKKFGFKPTRIVVALDPLAVYVNKDNPIESLSLPQIDAIFSRSCNGGCGLDISTWGQTGLKGGWAGKPINPYGRNSASGTYDYFKKHVLFNGDYKDIVKEQPSSASVVLAVTEDVNGIGYSGIGYKTSGVKAIALSRGEGGEAYEPTCENVLAGNYPLARRLYLYVVKKPNRPLPKTVEEFIRFALSREGQQIVMKNGYLPLPAGVLKDQLAALK
jgi:phosphate transport system substrate-binding protein